MQKFILPFLYFVVLAFTGCTEKSSNSAAPASAASSSANSGNSSAQVIVSGSLSLESLPAEVNDPASPISLTNREVKVLDASGSAVATAFTKSDGSYKVIVPGSLILGSGETTAALAGTQLQLESVVSNTHDDSVIGVRTPLNPDVVDSSGQLALGPTALTKITAIRGKATLDGAKDHTGISVYVPGTSYAARTDSAGQFLMTFIPAGSYALQFEKDGYLPQAVAAVAVSENETAKVSLQTLHLSGGAGLFSVKQLGTEGVSASRKVEFLISAGDADRFKGGTLDEVETMSYGAVPGTFSYTFTEDGEKQLKMVFATADGYESSVVRSIIVDTISPNPSTVKLADRSSLSATHTNERLVVACHSTCQDLAAFAILPDSATSPRDSDFIWPCNTAPSASDTLYRLPADTTTFAYKIWARDRAGNVSAEFGSGSIQFDNTPPTAPTLSLTDQTSNSNAGTNTTTVYGTLSDCNDVEFVLISESQLAQPQRSEILAPCTTAANAYSHTFANDIEGIKTVLVWVVDYAGNIGPVSSTSTITLDKTTPSSPNFTLSDPTPSQANYSNSLTLKATPGNCTDVSKVLISETQSSRPSENDSGWLSCSTTGVSALAVGEGSRTFYLWAKDIGGNVTTSSTSASINVDTTPPAAPTISLENTLTGDSQFTKLAAIKANIGSCGDSAAIYLTESSSVPSESQVSVACVSSDQRSFTLNSSSEGTHVVYLWSKDLAGNVSSSAAQATIAIDTTPPALPTNPFTVSDSVTGATAGYTKSNTINFSIGSCPNAKILLRDGQSTAPSPLNSESWASCNSSGSLTLTDTNQGSKTIYLWTRDAAGNVSTAPLSTTIYLDTINPDPPALSQSTSSYNIATHFTQVTASAIEAGATAYYTMTTNGSTPADPTSSSPNTLTTSSTTISGINQNGITKIKICQYDLSGRQSNIDLYTYTHDTTTPTIASVGHNGASINAASGIVYLYDTVHFTLNAGESDGTASVDIGGVRTGIQLYDDGTHGDASAGNGVYELDYTVQTGDDISSGTVIGHFTDSVGNPASNVNAGSSITIDATPTVVSSNISSDTTWSPSTGNGNPFVLSSDIVIQAGVTLTIDAGAVVKFRSGACLWVNTQASGSPAGIYSHGTNGNLVVMQTACLKIKWPGTNKTYDATNSDAYLRGPRFEYTNISGGTMRVVDSGGGSGPYLSHVTLATYATDSYGYGKYAFVGNSTITTFADEMAYLDSTKIVNSYIGSLGSQSQHAIEVQHNNIDQLTINYTNSANIYRYNKIKHVLWRYPNYYESNSAAITYNEIYDPASPGTRCFDIVGSGNQDIDASHNYWGPTFSPLMTDGNYNDTSNSTLANAIYDALDSPSINVRVDFHNRETSPISGAGVQ